MYRLCNGVAFVHGCRVLHRKLKPHNLLMDLKTRVLKIVDLCLSRAFTVPLKYSHEVWSGSLLALPPLSLPFDSCIYRVNNFSADPDALVQGA
jgi:serine/threonine protein kinase